MNRSRDPLTTPQRQQQCVCYALRVVAQSIEESPRHRSVAPRPETPTPQPGYIKRTRTSCQSSNREARSADLLASPRHKCVQRPQDENIPPRMLTSNGVTVTGLRQVVRKIMYFLFIIADLPSRPPSLQTPTVYRQFHPIWKLLIKQPRNPFNHPV